MTRAAKPKKPARNAELGKIHILKAKLGLQDEQYRALLWAHGRVDSAANLDEHGRRRVIEHLVSHLKARDGGYAGRPNNIESDARRELKKIEALLADAGLPWSYAEAVMRSQTRGTKQRLEWCSERELVGILAALEKAALKRLAAGLEGALGSGWRDDGAGIARLLFGFDAARRQFDRYSEVMSKVLRWLRGELGEVFCLWPADAESASAGCCSGCLQRLMRSGIRG